MSWRGRIRQRVGPLFAGGIGSTTAATVGLLMVAGVGIVLGQAGGGLSSVTEGLLLVLPVVFAAALGTRWSAYLVAAGATVVFSLLVPPVGSIGVELLADFVGLVTFFVVAVAVSTLVGTRIEALGRVEQQRRVLLRSVSHDLRTPLAAIRAAASDLLDGADYDPATRRRLLELVGDEAERLDRLVGNLLSLSRVDAGALHPSKQSVDLAELVEFSTRRLDRLFTSVCLHTDVPAELPPVDADFTQLDLMLSNLLENAARHSPAGGEVRVAARADADSITLTVSDQGPGIDPDEVAAIFEPFRSGAIAGTSGIGLAICKAVAEAHGGTITAGDAPTGGARFTVVLPL
jgi:signal transduction histidine kinase